MTLAISFTHKKQYKFAVSWKWMGGSVEVLNGSLECLAANYICIYVRSYDTDMYIYNNWMYNFDFLILLLIYMYAYGRM